MRTEIVATCFLLALTAGAATRQRDGRAVELGARLFADERFGAPLGDFSTSCASCHFFDENHQGPRAGADFLSRSWIAYRVGDPRRHTLRNAPTIFDVKSMPALHFDGEFASLEALVSDTLTGRTMGWLPAERDAAMRRAQSVAAGREYRPMFAAAYGVDVAAIGAADATALVARAIADFTRSLESPRNSPYDRFIAANGLPERPGASEDAGAFAERLRSAIDDRVRRGALKLSDRFDERALEGMRIFFATTGDARRGNCVTCHAPPLFTDRTYHNIGISQAEYDRLHGEGRFAALQFPGPRDGARPVARLREIPDPQAPAAVDLGYWNFVNLRASRLRRAGEDEDRFLERMVGTFKTPALRNLAYTSPYMHNGAYGSLPAAIEEMIRLNALAAGGRLRAADDAFTAMRITQADVAPLAAFLDALNDTLPGRGGRASAAPATPPALPSPAGRTSAAPASYALEHPAQVEFRVHPIDTNVPGGYAVLVHDVNNDGKPDVLGVSMRSPELAWYENPTWQRHAIVDGMTTMVNLAAADLDGDGIPEIALQSGFAMAAARSDGLVWLLRHDGDPRRRWKAERLDRFTTSHHIAWADVDGDGKKELINAPLIGPNSLAPTYDQDKASLFWYRQGDWKRRVITDSIAGILHRVRPVAWDADRRDELIAASFEGITLYWSTGTGDALKWEHQRLSAGHSDDKAPRLGASDVAVGRAGNARILASVEPWHGNEIVVYSEAPRTEWKRTVLFSDLVEGHEVALADLNGDGRDDIVAGDRSSRGATVHVMYAPKDPAGTWAHQAIDGGKMAASGCTTADINGDRRPDIVCIGASTANIVWYENAGPR